MSEREEYQDADEIREGRGWLPAWWIWLMYAGFAYALVYVIYMHGIAGWSQEKQYAEEIVAFDQPAMPCM